MSKSPYLTDDNRVRELKTLIQHLATCKAKDQRYATSLDNDVFRGKNKTKQIANEHEGFFRGKVSGDDLAVSLLRRFELSDRRKLNQEEIKKLFDLVDTEHEQALANDSLALAHQQQALAERVHKLEWWKWMTGVIGGIVGAILSELLRGFLKN